MLTNVGGSLLKIQMMELNFIIKLREISFEQSLINFSILIQV